MSKVSAVYHIVFATKNREMTLSQDHIEELYRFIWSIITESQSSLYRIGGIANHIHILLNLNPSVALATLVRNIKSCSSKWLKKSGNFPNFSAWASEYYASTLSYKDKDAVIEYIKGQKLHHSIQNLDEEFSELMRSSGLQYYEDDLK